MFLSKVLKPNQCNHLIAFTSSRLSSRTLQTRRNPGSRVPFLENYRNNWPATEQILPEHVSEPTLPPRTISDSCLRFKLTSTFDHGSSIFYPHLSTHPADLKVTLKVPLPSLFLSFFLFSSKPKQVSVKDLPLTAEELPVFLRMVGPRYDRGKEEVRIVCKRFANRIENKRFSVLLLERLLGEARRLTAQGLEYEKEE